MYCCLSIYFTGKIIVLYCNVHLHIYNLHISYVWSLRSIGVVVSSTLLLIPSRVTSLSPTCGENRTTQPSTVQRYKQ